MAYPDKPQILTSYTAEEQSIGNGSLPGQELDVDFASLKVSQEQVIDFLKLFTRSDGKLANGIVTQEALAPSILIGFDPPTVWATAQDYTTRSTVFQGQQFYLCVIAHTSSVFATDLSAGRWQLLADLTPVGGALLASNNLSDLADAAAARANLGLGSMAALNSGTSGGQFRTNSQNEAVFQPLDATLTAFAGVTGSADVFPYFTGADAFATAPVTAFARTILDDANAAAVRATIGAQASDAALTSLAGLSLAAGDVLYATGADTVARLAIGTAGQVLRVNTGATAPEWATASGLQSGTSQATTSGTVVDFNGVIPATASRITVIFDQVSVNAVDTILVQVGTSGGIVSTGYSSGGAGLASATAGFGIPLGGAIRTITGHMVIAKLTGNTWVASYAVYDSTSATVVGGGRVALGGTLDRLRVTSATPSTFDNGSVNIMWE